MDRVVVDRLGYVFGLNMIFLDPLEDLTLISSHGPYHTLYIHLYSLAKTKLNTTHSQSYFKRKGEKNIIKREEKIGRLSPT